MIQVPVAIGLGSNRGDRLRSLSAAAKRVLEDVLQGGQASSVYETQPWGGVATEPFLNAVLVGRTDWQPPALVHYLKQLELELGRVPGARLGDREIDLDLLAFGDVVWESEGVKVPHPGLPHRDFVLLPLGEVWPHWPHPTLKKTPQHLLADLEPQGATHPRPIGALLNSPTR